MKKWILLSPNDKNGELVEDGLKYQQVMWGQLNKMRLPFFEPQEGLCLSNRRIG